MKLHLPLSLLAAVALACFGTGQSWAGTTTTTAKTTVSDANSIANGNTYSGFIYKVNTVGSGNKVSTTTFDQVGTATSSTGTATGGTTNLLAYYANNATNAKKVNELGDLVSSGGALLWNYYCDGQSGTRGNTLLLGTQTADKTLETDYTPSAFGGLIVEASNYAWTLGRAGSTMKLMGNSTTGVNLTIGANTTLKASDNGRSIEVINGGSWEIANGKTLTLQTPNVNISSGQTVNISVLDAVEGSTAGITVTGNLTAASTSSLVIGEGITLTMSNGKLDLTGATLTNSGTIDLGTSSTLQLKAANTYTAGTYTVGSLSFGNRDINDVLAGLTSRQNASYANNVITITGGAISITWNAQAGAGDATWTTDGVWLNGETVESFVSGDSVTFGAGDSLNKKVGITGNISAGSVTIQDDYEFNVTANSTISGAFSMAEGTTLTKTGDATLTMDSTTTGSLKTFSVQEGTVNLNNVNLNIQKLEIANEGIVNLAGGTYTHVTQTHIKDGGTLSMAMETYYKCNDIIIDGGGILTSHSKRDLGTTQGTITINATADKSAIIKGNLYGSLWMKSAISGKGLLEFQQCHTSDTNSIRVHGVISDGTEGAYAGTLAVKQSSGYTDIYSTNTYTGGTTVTGGGMNLLSTGGLGSGDVDIQGGKVTVSANDAIGTGKVYANGGTLTVGGTARTLDNTLVAGNKTASTFSMGATDATYKNVIMTNTGIDGTTSSSTSNGVTTTTQNVAEITGTDISVTGAYALSNTKLTNVDITIIDGATLTNTAVTLDGTNTLTFSGSEYTLDGGIMSTNVLSGTTLTGSVTIDFSSDLLSYVEANLGAGNTLTITLGSITLPEATGYALDGAPIQVSEALTSSFGEASLLNNSGSISITFAGKSSTDTIPEPTTATLSLLALAGLAARRRRK